MPNRIHVWHIGVSKNNGTPKWMVYNGKALIKWMIWVFSETSIYLPWFGWFFMVDENTPWSKYMAQSPKAWLIHGLYKPIRGNCAIYFYPGVGKCTHCKWIHHGPMHDAHTCANASDDKICNRLLMGPGKTHPFGTAWGIPSPARKRGNKETSVPSPKRIHGICIFTYIYQTKQSNVQVNIPCMDPMPHTNWCIHIKTNQIKSV